MGPCYSGKDLIAWGFTPGPWFPAAIRDANILHDAGASVGDIRAHIGSLFPKAPPEMAVRTNAIPFGQFLDTETDDEVTNLQGVITHMDALLRTPTIVAGAVMPDACPSGSELGTIPVGGVVATKEAIHPGFHSADICCSMAITVFNRDEDVSNVLDIAMKTTDFGPGKRSKSEVRQNKELGTFLEKFAGNKFLSGLEGIAEAHFMTQGDGNHFFYVGHLKSTGQLAIVTHHGSRGLGADLYKRGMVAAKRHTEIVSPRTPPHNSWIDSESEHGEEYWKALQLIREWTKMNHFAIHDAMAKKMGNAVVGRMWNEHNFVFRKSDGLFYHGKGATPNFAGFSEDDSGRTLIPLNMSQPILIAEHLNNPGSLGFAPHGAGRNLSRTTHFRRLALEFGADSRGLSDRDKQIVMDRETKGIDARFFTGKMDLSELPSAYKNATAVREQINRHKLATIVDEVLPGGSIMAGESSYDWRSKKKAKKEKESA